MKKTYLELRAIKDGADRALKGIVSRDGVSTEAFGV
jgi:hypothetical protein